jgi:hypothetical protein
MAQISNSVKQYKVSGVLHIWRNFFVLGAVAIPAFLLGVLG